MMALSDLLLQGCPNSLVQLRSNKNVTRLMKTRLKQYCYIMIVTDLLDQPCDKSNKISNDVTSC